MEAKRSLAESDGGKAWLRWRLMWNPEGQGFHNTETGDAHLIVTPSSVFQHVTQDLFQMMLNMTVKMI